MSNGKTPIENELLSSQMYKTLSGSGSRAAEMLADGMNRVARGADEAIFGKKPIVSAANAQVSQTQQSAQGGGYSYSYTYGAGQQGAGQAQGGNAQQNQQPRQPQQQAQQPQLKLVRRRGPVRFYVTGAAAILYALLGPMSEPGHFIVFFLVLAGVFAIGTALFKGKKEWVPIEQPAKKPEPEKKAEEKKASTGNPEIDKLIEEGNEYLKKLRAANDAIPDETLSRDIERMENASRDIFSFVADHPQKLSQIRKFMNYYLPTTLKLLDSYRRLSAQSVRGENISSTMFNIAGMMHTVADAFEKQLDSLFSDEAMDISADISVFETLLKQEGFVEENTNINKEK